jgi:hypothetical protein
MYYEEKIIDGVLYWRSTPKGMWTQFSAEELTKKLMEERDKWKSGMGKPIPADLAAFCG